MSCPNPTSSSVIYETTRSVPPYSLGGTLSYKGATCAIFMIARSPAGCHHAGHSRSIGCGVRKKTWPELTGLKHVVAPIRCSMGPMTPHKIKEIREALQLE